MNNNITTHNDVVNPGIWYHNFPKSQLIHDMHQILSLQMNGFIYVMERFHLYTLEAEMRAGLCKKLPGDSSILFQKNTLHAKRQWIFKAFSDQLLLT